MTRKFTLFAQDAFEVALILFVFAWISLAGVLPDASPEYQCRFALCGVLDDDLVTSEAAFAEIVEVNMWSLRRASNTAPGAPLSFRTAM